MPKILVDGREVEAPAGELVIVAAERVGIVIPRFCYHERLVPVAACRLCLVEIEGVRGLQPSCATPVKDGMKVSTQTPAVLASHAEVLGNVLSYHPLDCPKCERSGCCQLQDFSYEFAPKELPIYQPPGLPGPDYKEASWGEIIRYDPYKCVKCYRCTRACDELADVRALTVAERGHETRIATFGDGPLSCDYCGICVDVCPTGAISQWPSKFLAKDWEYAKTEATCAHCSVGCRFDALAWEGHLAAAKTRPDLGSNRGNLCAKGRYAYDFGEGEGRITAPLLRDNGTLRPASWREALARAAEGIRKAKAGDVAGVASGDLSACDLWNFGRLLRDAIGTTAIYPEGGEADRSVWLAESIGTYAATAPLEELERHQAILVAGFDPWDEAPVIAQEIQRVARVRNIPLYLAGVSGRLDSYAGMRAASLKDLAIPEGRIAVFFSSERIGFSDLERIVTLRPEWGPGGSNLYPVGARANGRALAPLGIFPHLLPGLRPRAAGAPPVAPAAARVLLMAGARLPKGAEPDFLVASAVFRAPDLDRADVLFPAATAYEKPGTFLNFEGRPQTTPGASVPPGEAWPDAAAWQALAAALGANLPQTPAEIRAEVAREVPGLLDDPRWESRRARPVPFPDAPTGTPLPAETMFTGHLADPSPWLAKVRRQNEEAQEFAPR